MGQTQRISKNNTKIDGGVVWLHQTAIVEVDDNMNITLNSGGWRTATTKTRMNQVANEWNLGFQVFQHDFNWFLLVNGKERLFRDNMTFNVANEALRESLTKLGQALADKQS